MAYNFFSILVFLFILNIFVGSALAGRDIGIKESNVLAKRLAKSFKDIHHDDTVVVPGLGRYYKFPRPGTKVNPFTYNPVTGKNGGTGVSLPIVGSGSYIPGGDDTLIPNPGVEIPNPSRARTSLPANP